MNEELPAASCLSVGGKDGRLAGRAIVCRERGFIGAVVYAVSRLSDMVPILWPAQDNASDSTSCGSRREIITLCLTHLPPMRALFLIGLATFGKKCALSYPPEPRADDAG